MDITQHWKTVMDTMQDGLLVVDNRGTIVALNPAAEEITGYDRDELEGRNCTVLNCTGCRLMGLGEEHPWCSLFEEGVVRAKRCTITNKQGHRLEVIKRASVLLDDQGQAIGAVETLIDISALVALEQEVSTLRRTLHTGEGRHGMLGRSQPMAQLFSLIDNVAVSDAPVLITGESGSGKELVARALHEAGPRAEKPFIKVNCAALNQNLLESELFGHVRGAFTGADRDRVGRFEAAHGGDIFLDEIGDLPLATQVKLLRVLEGKEIERVGDHKPIPVDVRIITATNRDLEELIAQGSFREDLYYRINVVPLEVPALRERLDDLPIISRGIIQRLAAKNDKAIHGLTPEALEAMLRYPWPGNVRELVNSLEYAFVLCPSGLVDLGHLPARISGREEAAAPAGAPPLSAHQVGQPRAKRPDLDRERLLEVLRQCKGNQSQAARVLGVSRVTIWKRLKHYGISLKKEIG